MINEIVHLKIKTHAGKYRPIEPHLRPRLERILREAGFDILARVPGASNQIFFPPVVLAKSYRKKDVKISSSYTIIPIVQPDFQVNLYNTRDMQLTTRLVRFKFDEYAQIYKYRARQRPALHILAQISVNKSMHDFEFANANALNKDFLAQFY